MLMPGVNYLDRRRHLRRSLKNTEINPKKTRQRRWSEENG